jgi:hypothetical protein
MAVAQVKDRGRGEPVAVAQGVDRHDRVHQRLATRQLVRGAHGSGDGDAADRCDLVRLELPAVDRQPGSRAPRPTGYDDVDRRVRWSAGGVEQLGGGVPADAPTTIDKQVRRPRPHGEVDLDVGAEVHVRKQSAKTRSAEHTRGEQAGRDGVRATEGVIGIHRHAVPDGPHAAPVP